MHSLVMGLSKYLHTPLLPFMLQIVLASLALKSPAAHFCLTWNPPYLFDQENFKIINFFLI